MLGKILGWFLILSATAGCMTAGTRDRPFTDDWADHVRDTPGRDRHAPQQSEKQTKKRLGPAVVTQDESGRPQLFVGGKTGLGVDIDYRRGPSGRLRYRRQWDFVRPDRNR
jgi:hypothetical protein